MSYNTLNYMEQGGATWNVGGTLNLLSGGDPLNFSQNDGTDAANALLMGIGTDADPSTTAVADNTFLEFRTESTATSGDSRCLYIRHALNGTGVSGEAIRAWVSLTKAGAACRGAHISLDVGTGGSVTGAGYGVDASILFVDAAIPAGGTYAGLQSELYSWGASTDVSGVTNLSFIRLSAGGNATGATTVEEKAYFLTLAGVTAGSGKFVDTDITTHSAYAGLRVDVAGTTKWIAVVSD